MNFLLDVDTAADPAPLTQTNFERLDGAAGIGRLGASSIVLEDAAAGADLKKFYASSSAGLLALGTLNDAGDTFTPLLRLTASGKLGIGADPTTPNLGLFLQRSPTEASGSVWGANVQVISTPAATSSAEVRGAELISDSANGNAQTFNGTILGAYILGRHRGTGTAALVLGATIVAQKGNTGPVTSAHALRLEVSNLNATGTLATAIGLYIPAFTASGAITNRWGVYQEGTAENNCFKGNVLIGTSAIPSSITNGFVIRTGAAPTGTVNSGDAALWFDGTNLRVRIGATSYTFTKT